MYFEDQQQLPVLLPIKNKKSETSPNSNNPEKPAQSQENLSIFPRQNTNVPEKDSKKLQKQMKINIGLEKVDEFDQKFKNIHELSQRKEEKQKRKVNNREKQMQKSKGLIGQMMRKIDAKNITEQLYPVTNQTIAELIRKMDVEIDDLKADAEKKQSSLSSNPNNQHLKSQIQVLKSSIDRCVTIKELYNQKINLRNKISILERNNITLRQQNTNLKIKISRGIETISNHMHNLPCEKEKELIVELKKCEAELKNQREMRIKLQGNISDIVLNFKRLYEEADTARLIITHKLKELQQKQRKIVESQSIGIEKEQTVSQKRSPQMQALEQRKMKKSQGPLDVNSDYSLTNKKSLQYHQFSHSPISQDQNKAKQKEKQMQKVSVSGFSLEQQIRKMRINQVNLSKTQYK